MARIVHRPGGEDRVRPGPLRLHEPREPDGPATPWPPLGEGLVCNICGDRAHDRRHAERHRERVHPEAAGSVHHRG